MLHELVVSNLGVIRSASVVFTPGMSALTGETGAGKTLIVGAIDLLLGGKTEAHLVRADEDEARVDGRFVDDDTEIVLSRVVPRVGRSRAYIDGRPVSASALAVAGSRLIDLHGQHAHQGLLGSASQREALDAYGHVDEAALRTVRAKRRELLDARAQLGGDERARAREIDLLRYQVDELRAASITSAAEDDDLATEEVLLSTSQAERTNLVGAIEALGGDEGVLTLLGSVRQLLGGSEAFVSEVLRAKSVSVELDDLASELRSRLASLDDNPDRLSEIRERRHSLRQLRRKYGDTLAAVMSFADDAGARLADLESFDARAAEIDRSLAKLAAEERVQRDAIAATRCKAAEPFQGSVERHLRRLALPNAQFRVAVTVDDEPAREDSSSAWPDSKVSFLFSANPGNEVAPLSKVASGGELARVMLALQLALLDAPTQTGTSTLVFDEVDAGIGGETALAVGDALAELGMTRQVLVVTHLAQVAASAASQINVHKSVGPGSDGSLITATNVVRLSEHERIGEVARMLAGDPASPAALLHAETLLAARRSRRETSVNANPGNGEGNRPSVEARPPRMARGKARSGADIDGSEDASPVATAPRQRRSARS